MYAKQPKKLLILNILDILWKDSDQDHRLTQREIGEILRTRYGMAADRKAIKRNLMDLVEFGFDIEYREVPRGGAGEEEENTILTDFYLVRPFTEGELRLLIDGLLFSRHLPHRQCRELVEKLKGLSSRYFHSRVRHIVRMPEEQEDNQQLFLNIELLDEAIEKRQKAAFHYLEYGTDKKAHYRTRSDGSVREYVISPYQMAARDGNYYLVCRRDGYEGLANYRLDRICDLKILEEAAQPFTSPEERDEHPQDLSAYMREHIYMYAGGSCHAKLWVNRSLISSVIDLFGKDVVFSREDAEGVVVSVYANEMSIEQFAKSYAPNTSVLEPPELRKKVGDMLRRTAALYE